MPAVNKDIFFIPHPPCKTTCQDATWRLPPCELLAGVSWTQCLCSISSPGSHSRRPHLAQSPPGLPPSKAPYCSKHRQLFQSSLCGNQLTVLPLNTMLVSDVEGWVEGSGSLPCQSVQVSPQPNQTLGKSNEEWRVFQMWVSPTEQPGSKSVEHVSCH